MRVIIMYILSASKFAFWGAIIGFIYVCVSTKKHYDWKKKFVIVLFCAYINALLSQTVFPRLYLTHSASGIPFIGLYFNEPGLNQINIIPFHSILSFIHDMSYGNRDDNLVATYNVIGNILLFVPMGVLLPEFSNRIKNLKSTLCVSAVVSGGIELIQFLLNRSPDIDDVILNTFGALTGYLLINTCKRIVFRTRSSSS